MLMRRRMCRYVGPVVFLAILLNITKFFEAYVVYSDDGKILLRVSSMRKDPLYSAISKWTRLLILGLFPFCIILYLNFKVYVKLNQRSMHHRSSYQNGRQLTTNGFRVCTYKLGLFGTLKLVLALQFIVTNAYFSVACNTKVSVRATLK